MAMLAEYFGLVNENKPTLESDILYWIGRPEVSPSGRFGRKVTTFQTARLDDNGDIKYEQQSYSTYGKLDVPSEVVHVTKLEFKKLLKNFNDFQLT